jgi:hypothetical protein
MSFPQISFQQLVWSLAFKAGLNPDASLGDNNIDAFKLASFADFLNDAVLWAWRPDPQRPEVVWPYTVASGTLSPSGGVIAWSDVGNADWWRLWSADPRPYSATPTAYPIGDTWDKSGIYPRSSASSVFGFWRPKRPRFTATAVNTGATYNTVGTLAYDSVSGNVYLSIAAGALGSALTDASKWTPQTVPDPLAQPILAQAEGYRVKSKGNDPSKLFEEAAQLLQFEKARALPQAGAPSPWSFDLAA